MSSVYLQVRSDLRPNTAEFERSACVAPAGFREYDVRWRYPEQINLPGLRLLGAALGAQMHARGIAPDIAVGHDYRSYSAAVKEALMSGLILAGVRVHDVGLVTSPGAYFAQFALNVPAVAMVTASHNENGWTGVKIGIERPLTHGPDEIGELRTLVLSGELRQRPGGGYVPVPDLFARYVDDLASGPKLSRPLRAVVATGNGTAGPAAVEVLTRLGVEVIPLHTELDYTFPHYNPNPEDLHMLHDVAAAVTAHGADVGLAFDGDGDRCGAVDATGREIFADKLGLLLARRLANVHPNAHFVLDVKSTGLFADDPELKAAGATTEYYKTGHSYMKRRVHATGAVAGFEKSGHFFFNRAPGRGYDDGILAAIAVCRMLDETGRSLADLYDSLPVTYASPTVGAYCPDERKYGLVDELTARLVPGTPFAGSSIETVNTVNGVLFTLAEGARCLIRASSNKPSLVIVTESARSPERMREAFEAIDRLLREYPEVGEYDQRP